MIAILDPFSGISGDMTLGALLDLGLDQAWLEALPAALGLDGVTVRVQEVRRGEIVCRKVDFDIPPQPHGRHIREIERMLAAVAMPDGVHDRARAVFRAIAEEEGRIHGMPAAEVHLHEVGAVDAILDVVGAVWGLHLLGVTEVYCGPMSVGDGFVTAAHGVLPVPAPATLRLLEGLPIRPGPAGAGELVTPTGAALVRVLSRGAPPAEYTPVASGYGAGSKDPRGRANALRIILARPNDAAGRETLVTLAADLDDMTPEYVAAAADALRAAGARDVTLLSVVMKKGRAGTRIEATASPDAADAVEAAFFAHTTTLGVRRWTTQRTVLARSEETVDVGGHAVRVKTAALPDGGVRRKPEFEDVAAAARRTGRPALDIFDEAASPRTRSTPRP